jgi:predicted Zn-dependent protease
VVLAVGAGVAASWGTIRTTWARTEGLEAAQAGDFARAEPILRGVLDRRPDDPEVIEALARGYAKTGAARGEPVLSRWVALQPGQTEPLRTRMDYYRKAKQREEAFADGRELLKLRPSDFDLRQTVMNLGFSTGHFAEAEELCRECLRQQPNDARLLSMLAEIRRARGDSPGAAAILDRLLVLQPRNTGAMFARAVLADEGGEPEKAVSLLREVLRLDPQRQRTAGYRLSMALARSGQKQEAEQVLAEVRRLQDVGNAVEAAKSQPENLGLKVRLGESLIAQGHTQDGLRFLTEALARDAAFAPAHRAMAAYYEKHGQASRAAEHRRLAGLSR